VLISSTGNNVHDVIVHHLRHVGDGGHSDSANDIWGLDGDDGEVYNVILDHITGTAANDGVFDIYGNVRDVTISWNLITDTETALHLSQENDVRARISLHHNVFARNNERQIRMRHHNDLIDFVNNVIYGWGWLSGGGAGLDIATNVGVSNDEFPKLNVENNYYIAANGSAGRSIERDIDGQIYFNGNVFPASETDDYSTATRWAIPSYAQVTTFAASALGDAVVPCVGTHYPTAAERDLLDEVSTAIGGAGGSCP
jgi:pectate lyase